MNTVSLEVIADFNIVNDVAWHGPLMPLDTEVFIPCFGDVLKVVSRLPFMRYRSTGILVQHIAVRHIENHAQLIQILAKLRENKVTHLLLIGGSNSNHGMFDSTIQLLKHIDLKPYGITHVYFAGHPEGHIAKNALNILREKVDLARQQGYQTGVVSQFTFDREKLFQWMEKVEEFLPRNQIRIGVVSPTSLPKLIRIARICGVHLPLSFLIKQAPKLILGRHLATGLVRQILAYAPDTSFHIYTMGRVEFAIKWILSEIKK